MNNQVTILEYINEYGNYVFYGVYAGRDPKNAVENYLLECGLAETIKEADKTIEHEDGEYFVKDVCRAYEVELE